MRSPVENRQRGRSGGRELLRGHDIRYIYRGLWRYLSHYRLLLLGAILLTLVSSVLSITGTSLAGSAIGAIAGEAAHPVSYYLIGMLVCYLLAAVISYSLSVLMHHLSQSIVDRMRTDVYDRLVELPVGFFDRRQAGELVSIISYDVNTVSESLSSDFLQIISSLATVVYSFILMLTVSARLILVFCVTIPLSVLSTAVISRIVRPLFRRRSVALGEMNGYAEEMIAGHRTVKAYGAEEAIITGFTRKNREAADAYEQAEANGTVAGPTVNFINNLSLTLVNIVGALLYMGILPGGLSLTGFSQFVLLSRKFSGPINQISNIYADIQSALAAAERVFRLIDEEPEPQDLPQARPLGAPRGEVVFSHVTFGYTPERTVLHDLSFRAPAGSVTAIVGPTGAGKTTLINILMRFYEWQQGQILLDGTDIRLLRRGELRAAFTMVLQDTWLFKGTVRENIAYGRDQVTDEEIEAVCRAARIHDFIMGLPEGYDTVISEAGTNVSKGQKQLLTIARAMLSDAPMLILDEATSNVDSATEQSISDAMVRLMRGRTCFVIAHRLSTVQNADRILVIREGDVVEMGTHQELMERQGFYRSLYEAQFELS